MITSNQRANYERTEDLLHEARALLTALYLADDAAPPRGQLDDNAQAVPALIAMIEKKIGEIVEAHDREWVGLGGVSERLTDDEIREAAGEFADEVLRKRAENQKRRQDHEANLTQPINGKK